MNNLIRLLVAIFILWPNCSFAKASASQTEQLSTPQRSYAVIIGVDYYPNLPEHQLHGCLQDAYAIGNELKARGFRVIPLPNPTCKQIEEALIDARSQRWTDFVFFFAGHGTNKGTIPLNVAIAPRAEPALMPSDSLPYGYQNDITATQLRAWVQAIPSVRRTIILDSCFSGAMMGASKGDSQAVSRFYAKQASAFGGQKGIDASNNAVSQDLTTRSSETSAICYATASGESESALEYPFDGEKTPRGIFSYYLEHYLHDLRSQGKVVTWGVLQSEVASEVSSFASSQNSLQNPEVSTQFYEKPAFPSSDTVITRTNPNETLLTLFNTTRNDDVVELHASLEPDFSPDQHRFNVGEHVELKVNLENPSGYLVVVEYGTSGRLTLTYPRPDKANLGNNSTTFHQVPAGNLSLGIFAFRADGYERFKAFLFDDQRAAKAFYDAFLATKDESTPLSKNLFSGQAKNFGVSAGLSVLPLAFVTSALDLEILKPEKVY